MVKWKNYFAILNNLSLYRLCNRFRFGMNLKLSINVFLLSGSGTIELLDCQSTIKFLNPK